MKPPVTKQNEFVLTNVLTTLVPAVLDVLFKPVASTSSPSKNKQDLNIFEGKSRCKKKTVCSFHQTLNSTKLPKLPKATPQRRPQKNDSPRKTHTSEG